MSVLISCEGGGRRIPTQLISAASASDSRSVECAGPLSRSGILGEDLSWDEVGRYVAERMSQRLHAPLITNEFSKELIDVSKSLHHRQLFPVLTRAWSSEDRETLVREIYSPYRLRIRQAIAKLFLHFKFVIHLSIRSFPLMHQGKQRRADCGLSYDPSRDEEVDLCLEWIDEMYEQLPMLRVRRNYPRRGTTDSITKSMRGEFAEQSYLGIELLVNRAWAGRALPIRDQVIDGVCRCLDSVLAAEQSDAAA